MLQVCGAVQPQSVLRHKHQHTGLHRILFSLQISAHPHECLPIIHTVPSFVTFFWFRLEVWISPQVSISREMLISFYLCFRSQRRSYTEPQEAAVHWVDATNKVVYNGDGTYTATYEPVAPPYLS